MKKKGGILVVIVVVIAIIAFGIWITSEPSMHEENVEINLKGLSFDKAEILNISTYGLPDIRQTRTGAESLLTEKNQT